MASLKTSASGKPATLQPALLPLSGRHLIEASAGTGKTYNITRLYIRLLLETDLSVQQILVMTFTRAATEELKGRIEKELRNTLQHWDELDEEFFVVLRDKGIDHERAVQRLTPALLELDEAAIFTIHGFCSRVLTQQAFASGIPLEIDMEADASEIRLEAVRDWLRQISHNHQAYALLLEQGWHQPETFARKFEGAIRSKFPVVAPSTAQLTSDHQIVLTEQIPGLFNPRKAEVLGQLLTDKQQIFSVLVEGHKDAAIRQCEWDELLAWLQCEDAAVCPKAVGSFISGARYSRKEPTLKARLTEIFDPIKQLRADHNATLKKAEEALEKRLDSAPAYQLAVQGIEEIKRAVAAAKQRLGQMDFDDLVVHLHDRIVSDDGEVLVRALREQYPVALVDEFQDTDPDQYGILSTVYPRGHATLTLMMIGDPKQAIYGFRGGDIFAYLAAREQADHHWYLDTNWRSVQQVVTGYNRLFWGSPLEQAGSDVFGYGIGYEQIEFTDKAAAAKQPLHDPSDARQAMNYVWLPEVADPSGADGNPLKGDYQQGLAGWCVNEILRLLAQARLGDAAIQEKDIAVLVRTGSEAKLVREALQAAGLPSVYLSDKSNVFKSEQARELSIALEGIWECENDRKLIAALSTYLLGGDAARLVRLHDPEHIDEWERARGWAYELRQLWIQKGCLAVILELLHKTYRPQPDQHERALTNLLHLAEILQRTSRQYKQPLQLLKWFRDQRLQTSAQEESEQRLESDENLIRIVTQHGSKGLEYPIVFIPFASQPKDETKAGKEKREYFKFHHPQSGEVIQQIGESDLAIDCIIQEGQAEAKRLLYVAVTRAAQRCYLGVAPFDQSEQSPLGLALGLGSKQEWPQKLADLADSASGSSMLLNIQDPGLQPSTAGGDLSSQAEQSQSLAAAEFTRTIADNWKLSSFSALARNAQSVRQDHKEHADEVAVAPSELPVSRTDNELPLRFTLKKGAAAGNLLHDILEHTDFSQPNWQRSIEGPLQRFGGLEDQQRDELILWLQQVLATELPDISGRSSSFSLSELHWKQTLRESEFYFPMEQLDLRRLIRCLQQHRDSDAPIFLPGQQQLQGMMHGFIDLVFEHQGRFYVADYKSTHLGDQFEVYDLASLQRNNQHHFYDLQYLIYSVALNRYLQKRLDDYLPELHFGGVYYLYLRGMSDNNQQPFGVFHTQIDSQLLLSLDRAFSARANQSEPEGESA